MGYITVGDVAICRLKLLESVADVVSFRQLKDAGLEAILCRKAGQWYYALIRDWQEFEGPFATVATEVATVLSDSFLQNPVDRVFPYLNRGAVVVGDRETLGLVLPVIVAEKLHERFNKQAACFQAIMDTVAEAVSVIDEDDRVIGWNERAEVLYGIPFHDIIDQPLANFFPDALLAKVLKEKKAVKEKYYRPRPGTHVLFTANAIKLDGKVAGAVCAERDITEIVQLNKELSRASLEVQSLKEEIDKITFQEDVFSGICGHSPAIVEAIRTARKIAGANVPVLLRGESGTGKEVFAQAIHRASGRGGAFVEINCGAIPVNLFESELFGYQAGAFTGADRKGKPGLMEVAHKGTLFLDELGELPRETQAKLLRAIEEKSFYRIGGDKPVKVDVRIIAATHRDLEQMIQEREFREDLYYRLNVVSIPLSPLRQRREDIPELVHRALKHFGALHRKVITRVDPAVMAVLLDYHWPGNVRELYNVLERMILLAENEAISTQNLPYHLTGLKAVAGRTADVAHGLLNATDALERELILAALQEAGFKKAVAAKRLGIPRSTLYYKMSQLGIKD